MKQIVRWWLVAVLLGSAPQLVFGAFVLIGPAEAQAYCNPHLKSSLNCEKPPRTTTKAKAKAGMVCVDGNEKTPGWAPRERGKKLKCEKNIKDGIKWALAGATIVVERLEPATASGAGGRGGGRLTGYYAGNFKIDKPLVLCVGNTFVSSAKDLRCATKGEILDGGTLPSKVFSIKPVNEKKPCIDIDPPFDSEVVISGVHVVASREYRAGECVWQKSGALRLLWSDLLGENTAVGMLALTGKSAHIEGNFIEGGQNGIKIFPPEPGTFVLLDNDISHAATGIRVQGGSNVFGIGNRVHDNSGDGIVGLEGDAFYARNEVIHNEGSGLRFDRDRLTHSVDRTEAEVIANTMDWNGRGEIRAEGQAVVGSAANCVVVKNKRDYRKHMRRYKKQQNMREYSNRTDEPATATSPVKPVPLGHSKKKNETGSLYTPVENVYWLETWGMFPTDVNACEGLGRKWKRRCVRYVQLCKP